MHTVNSTHKRHNEVQEDMMYCTACHALCSHEFVCPCCREEEKYGCSKEDCAKEVGKEGGSD